MVKRTRTHTGTDLQRYPVWETVATAREEAAALEPGSPCGIAGYIRELDSYWHFWAATGLWSRGETQDGTLDFPETSHSQPH